MSPGTCTAGAFFPDCAVSDPDPGPEVVDGSDSADVIDVADTATTCPRPGAGELVIHELNRAPAGRDFNGDGQADALADQFVEIVNAATTPLELQGLVLTVAGREVHVFESLCLSRGQAVVVFGGGSPGPAPYGAVFVTASTQGLDQAEVGTEIVALQGIGGAVIVSVETTQISAQAGKSWARVPDCTRGPLVEHPALGQWASSAGRMSDGDFFSASTCVFPSGTP